MSFGVQFTGEKISPKLQSIAKGMGSAQDRAVFASASVLHREVRKQIRDLSADSTGRLARSYQISRFKEGSSSAAGVLSDLIYARIQDQGGTIRPKRARNLAIPISIEAKKKSKQGLGPRDWPKDKLQLIIRKTGAPLLIEQATSRGKVKAFKLHYILKTSVTLTGKSYLSSALKKARGAMTKKYDAQIARSIREANKK